MIEFDIGLVIFKISTEYRVLQRTCVYNKNSICVCMTSLNTTEWGVTSYIESGADILGPIFIVVVVLRLLFLFFFIFFLLPLPIEYRHYCSKCANITAAQRVRGTAIYSMGNFSVAVNKPLHIRAGVSDCRRK